jgi:anti-sigma factor RsiW
VSCQRQERLWPRVLSGDLSSRQRRLFEAHLETCSECQARMRAYDQARQDVLQGLPQPADLSPGEQARILPDLADTRRQVSGRRILIATAAAAAIILVLVLLLLPGEKDRPAGPDGGRQPAVAARTDRVEMRMNTSDPKIKIVWVFDRNLNL